jgi:hypothetical protein
MADDGGLRTWWSDAVGTTALTLHVSPISVAAGDRRHRRRDGVRLVDAPGVSRACLSAACSRVIAPETPQKAVGRGPRGPLAAAAVFGAIGVALVVAASATGAIDPTGAFFGAGAALLADRSRP